MNLYNNHAVLPKHKDLPINLLSSIFNKTTSTYKFYWFLSIIQSIEKGNTVIYKKELFAAMLAIAWYTVNYFKLSFGLQDKIQEAIKSVKEIEKISIAEKQEEIIKILIDSENKQTINHLKHFDSNVPHWFVSPWFPGLSKKEIYFASLRIENQCLYQLFNDKIVINESWIDYLFSNCKIIKDFIYWNLAIFLQNRNPNVPDIPNKLIKPPIRASLNEHKKKFWDIVIQDLNGIICIYTGKKLMAQNYDLEHFIPHSFVSHNLMWNLIPADSSFNSAKNNKLPILDRYFDQFYEIQKKAVQIILKKNCKNIFLIDYYTIFPNENELKEFNKEDFKSILQPIILIASHNGFEFMI